MIRFLANRYFRLIRSFERLLRWLQVFDTRRDLRRDSRKIARKKGGSVINRQIKREIKQYCRERFGSTAYWHGVALSTEMRGEYMNGFIPFDYFYYEMEPRLNPKEYASIGDLRTLDYRRFGDFAIKPLFQYISNIFFNADFEAVGESELLKFLSDYNDTIVIKQEFGWGGKQVRVIHSSEFKPELLQRGKNFIIQPFLKQYKVLSELYPHSVNTFRVYTFRKKDGSVEVFLTYLRFGVDGTRVDNLSSGGQCLLFDSTGKPASISIDEFGIKADKKHKNTGFVFADLKIPMYQDIVDKCKSTHELYPYVRLIGWDICVDESGSPKLIEWNTHRPSFSWEDALFGPFFPDNEEIQ
jgi:hypothetical protein